MVLSILSFFVSSIHCSSKEFLFMLIKRNLSVNFETPKVMAE